MKRGRKKLRPNRTGKPRQKPLPTEELDYDPSFDKMTRESKTVRERFCREYIKDFNATAAIYRMGYKWKSGASQKGYQYLEDAYTNWYLSKLLARIEEDAIVTRSEVLFGLKREANIFGMEGSHSARISALRTLAKVLGMDIVKPSDPSAEHGGVMVVPMAQDLDSWEKNCIKAQEELKARAKE